MEFPFALVGDLFMQNLGLWWIILPATLIGIVVGILPGFGAQNTLMMLLPLTLSMDVTSALAFMIALYCATQLGGGVPAILFNMPGEGGAAATAIDGYPMTRKGKAQQALVLCFSSSVLAGLITTAVTIATLPLLAQLSYVIRSVEMIAFMVLGLTLIAAIASRDMLKGLIAGFMGLMIGSIGADPIFGTPRATFGFAQLYDGVPLIAALIGLFGISEALVMLEEDSVVHKKDQSTARRASWLDTFDGLRLTVKYWWQIVWTSLIGLIIGILPGAGATVAAFIAYHYSKLFSKTPNEYGKGHPCGVIAPESANNGVTSGTLVPVMALGIPGGATGAVMMIVLAYNGVIFGPRLFTDNPEIAYGVFVQMFVAYLLMLILIVPLARYMSRVVWIPTRFLVPLILSMIAVAAFSEREYIFDIGVALVFGVIGYIARKTNYEVTAMLIGVLMGPLFESYLLRSLRVGQGDPMILFSSPIGNVIWLMALASAVFPFIRARRKNGVLAQAAMAGNDD